MITLSNKDITLRSPEPEDLEILYHWENNPAIWFVSQSLVPLSRYQLKLYLEQAAKDIFETRQLRLMIGLNKENRIIGAIDLFDYDPFNRRAGLGILIAGENDRKKGYAAQALETLIAYAFEILKLHQLYANITPANSDSLNLFRKAGFVQTGQKKDWLWKGDCFEDELIFQLINPAY
ncbi:MAG: GNAT family N-acetyltransferase [Bacteroidota bacterium]